MQTGNTNNDKDIRGNWLSRFFFLWMELFIFRGFRRKITFQDIPNLPADFQIGRLKEDFQKLWFSQKNPSLLWTILRQNFFEIIRSGMYLAISNLCELCAIVMGWLVLEIVLSPEHTANMETQGIIYCSVFTLVSVIFAIVYPKYIYINLLLDIKTFTQCIIALYQKSFSLPQDVINQVSVGYILNLITNDIRSLEYKFYQIRVCIWNPLHISRSQFAPVFHYWESRNVRHWSSLSQHLNNICSYSFDGQNEG